MTAPALSVIIPAHNAEPYIAETLMSLTYQEVPLSDLEVVIVDDGSTDSTAEIARSAAQRLEHVQLISNPRPTGVSAARNTGLAAATGRVLTFLDADDWFARGHLQVMLAAITDLGVESVRCDQVLATGRSRQLRLAPVSTRGLPLRCADHIARGWTQTMVDYPNPFAGVYARSLLERGTLLFDSSLHSAEDREWNWRLMLNSETFAVVNSPGAYYRRDVSSSITAVYNASQLDFIRSCRKSIDETRKRPGQQDYTLKALHNLFALADVHLTRRAEISWQLRRQLIAGVAAAASDASRAELDAVFSSFKRDRARRLRPILRRLEGKVSA